ncbi:hypothetical protein IU449_11970 [Nocardia higoensis]|uniref:Uncharacterized protein n=1 Tax=Nocardia higoensis TaxID=228599 RepID=A0ABS0DAV1_9NOCA|nr:hypothetical protein [Nocardia higoensis]MBF6355250.1 hypothetical protein [Nocardia higoensis]
MGTASLFSGGTVSGDQSNPLIAEVEDSIEWYTGVSPFESGSLRWKPAVNAFAITFADRWPDARTY